MSKEMSLREAVLAVVATWDEYSEIGDIGLLNMPMDKLREALAASMKCQWELLAQPDDKAQPVAWLYGRRYGSGLSFVRPKDYVDEDGNLVRPRPLVFGDSASQPAARIPFAGYDPKFCHGRKPLTDEQILAVVQRIDRDHQYLPGALKQLSRAIEAAHGITNKESSDAE